MTLFKQHEYIFLVSLDDGRNWEIVPPEKVFLEDQSVDLSDFVEKAIQERHGDKDCEGCPAFNGRHCEIQVPITVMRIDYSRN